MKLSEKLTKGAGIAFNYFAGAAAILFGAAGTLISSIVWGITGTAMPAALIFLFFGAAPIGGGIWLFRRGRIQQQLLKVKLLKEAIRKLAFQTEGRLRPADLA